MGKIGKMRRTLTRLARRTLVTWEHSGAGATAAASNVSPPGNDAARSDSDQAARCVRKSVSGSAPGQVGEVVAHALVARLQHDVGNGVAVLRRAVGLAVDRPDRGLAAGEQPERRDLFGEGVGAGGESGEAE